MKAILISIRPQWVSKILNKEKTIEVRKRFPNDYVGWVYIYCTKSRPYLVKGNGLADYLAKEYDKDYIAKPKKYELYDFEDDGYSAEFYDFFNGKVVARFWCDKVEEIKQIETIYGYKRPLGEYLKDSCLSYEEMHNYLKSKNGYAIHITKLEIFNKPKEISDFHKPSWEKVRNKTLREEQAEQYRLTRAPQSWCFIEI